MSSKRRQCRNHPDVFCYICGEYVLEKYCLNVKDFTKKAYKTYFGIKLGDQEKSWAPHKVCKQRTQTLRLSTKGKVSSMWSFSCVITMTIFGFPPYHRNPEPHGTNFSFGPKVQRFCAVLADLVRFAFRPFAWWS